MTFNEVPARPDVESAITSVVTHATRLRFSSTDEQAIPIAIEVVVADDESTSTATLYSSKTGARLMDFRLTDLFMLRGLLDTACAKVAELTEVPDFDALSDPT